MRECAVRQYAVRCNDTTSALAKIVRKVKCIIYLIAQPYGPFSSALQLILLKRYQFNNRRQLIGAVYGNSRQCSRQSLVVGRIHPQQSWKSRIAATLSRVGIVGSTQSRVCIKAATHSARFITWLPPPLPQAGSLLTLLIWEPHHIQPILHLYYAPKPPPLIF